MSASITGYLLLAVIVGIVIWAIAAWNGLVALKHNVSKAWANIDVLLKQRHDELPKLVEVCRQYMQHERGTLEAVIAARGAVSRATATGDVQALGQAETQLRAGLGQLFALAEAYPTLKADETFRSLAARVSDLENAIADRREFYNESVNLNNVRIEQFPDLIIARFGGFAARPLLEFTEGEKADVNLKALFS